MVTLQSGSNACELKRGSKCNMFLDPPRKQRQTDKAEEQFNQSNHQEERKYAYDNIHTAPLLYFFDGRIMVEEIMEMQLIKVVS
mmetsp:Transcript_15303/g.22450  ORF Transcript_15303/g.22450 Transcript_15303/m.22450 type:complete len:84 (+) Transcript_15303:364-615(+)